MTLLIMAAGMGSRYGGIKQIEPVGANGELIIDYSIFDAIKAGFTRVVFVIRRDIERDFCDAIFNRIKKHINAEYVFQDFADLPSPYATPPTRKKPWGTGHAILAARHVISEPFCVINADDFYGREAFVKIAEFLRNTKSNGTSDVITAAMVGYKLDKTVSDQGSVSRGVCITDANNMVTEIKERFVIEKRGDKIGYVENNNFYELAPDSDVSMNFWGFSANLMPALNEKFKEFLAQNVSSERAEFPIPVIVGDLIDERKMTLKLLTSRDTWLGFTYPEDIIIVLTEIKKMNDAGVYPTPLWK